MLHPIILSQIELGEKELKLETLQGKVSELKKGSQSQDTPAKLQVQKMIANLCVFFIGLYPTIFLDCCSVHQVLENDLRKKISQVQKLHEQAKACLTDFTFQRKQLEDYISQMSAWLKSMEESLVSSPTGPDPEDICRVKVQSN